MSQTRVIHIEPAAPPKPAVGAPCNGCGLCCLAEPCPVGVVLSWRWRGVCRQLLWSVAEQRYQCGALQRVQHWPGRRGRLAARLLKRWIAAGVGCDAEWEAQAPR